MILVLKPMITEKSLALAKSNQYTFRVTPRFGKSEIKKAVERSFKVKVKNVTVSRKMGKTKTTRNRKVVKLGDWKKAVVTLSSGKIDLFERV